MKNEGWKRRHKTRNMAKKKEQWQHHSKKHEQTE